MSFHAVPLILFFSSLPLICLVSIRSNQGVGLAGCFSLLDRMCRFYLYLYIGSIYGVLPVSGVVSSTYLFVHLSIRNQRQLFPGNRKVEVPCLSPSSSLANRYGWIRCAMRVLSNGIPLPSALLEVLWLKADI